MISSKKMHLPPFFTLLICLLSLIITSSFFSFSSAMECKVDDSTSSKVAYTITVSTSGDGNFTKVQDAVDSIPSRNDRWIRILLKPGIYKEQVKIAADKPCIVLQGHGRSDTTITFDAHEKTDKSPTMIIFADNVVVREITFENTYTVKKKGEKVEHFLPAVATRVYADKVAFYSCAFKGYQDTLWDDNGRHYYKNCYIEGAVDFIWGGGQSIYEDCEINVIDGGFVTAQGRKSADDPSGYVFRNCVVHGDGHGCLGRAYGPYSRVIFVDSTLTQVVDPPGWNIWRQQGHEGDVVYAEVDCKGSGTNSSERVPWMKKLSQDEVAKYTKKDFIDQEGWISKQP